MARREKTIARSITHSILHSSEKRPNVFARLPNYFWLYYLKFECVREELFKVLRETWQINEHEYRASFGVDEASRRRLKAMGDMGFSGSTFFATQDQQYIVKSIPRHFEHSFFKNDLMVPYVDYMQQNPNSLLTRITNFLECYQSSVGTLLGLAPTHHIVMENLLYGKEENWEDWDLKPQSYFYPERDIADGALTSEATKNKLADDFDDKIVLTLDQAEDLKAQLQKDTKSLMDCNCVDYSLMLVRIPVATAPTNEDLPAKGKTPLVPPGPPSWRVSVKSADGKWIYRAALLDFFWSKHKVHAKAMTALISAYNVVDKQGHMSVTTDSTEYRNRFLSMVADFIEVHEAAQDPFAG
ncbi:Putative phosphatidylinositol-4-phosphate 5-kinase, core [Septoria linicola]|uniref:Phosphatidylinositol-4-phosphate 5-kinase, core n=1 Tax=Septoria linicola TaxID=215465 RepID=A0A9Q9AI60_9PEZI|nr:putative phosphatidylinositol-4-phosphate 5-kinase, core [Septoria linicola]USW47363.1 Putative phosphatidylinositol-4-phosphate 5-kinase, core [Septoria linicola]